MGWMSYDICFCNKPKCADPSKCRRNPERLKKYPYPVAMGELADLDANGNCANFYPWETRKLTKKEQDEVDFYKILSAYLKDYNKGAK